MSDESSSDDERDDAFFHDDVEAYPSKVYGLENEECFLNAYTFSQDRITIRANRDHVVPFIPFKRKDDSGSFREKILYRNLDRDAMKLTDRFDRLFDGSVQRDSLTGHKDVDWQAVDARYSKEPRMTHNQPNKLRINRINGEPRKGHADNRLAFNWMSMFLTKQNFTFGIRKTGENERVILVVYEVPFLFYKLKEGRFFDEGHFYAGRKCDFDAFLLRPDVSHTNSPVNYVVPENTCYLVMTLQKTLFSVFRLERELFDKLFRNSAQVKFTSATDDRLKFRPKTPEELEMLARQTRAQNSKRGRPPKSLDSLYWHAEGAKKRRLSEQRRDDSSGVRSEFPTVDAAAVSLGLLPRPPPSAGSSTGEATATTAAATITTPVTFTSKYFQADPRQNCSSFNKGGSHSVLPTRHASLGKFQTQNIASGDQQSIDELLNVPQVSEAAVAHILNTYSLEDLPL